MIREKIGDLEIELEEAQNWTQASRCPLWAQKWADELEERLRRARMETIREASLREPLQLPIRQWPAHARKTLALGLKFFTLLLLLTPTVAAQEQDLIPIQTIIGEARGESLAGQIAVGEVIRERIGKRWFGHDAEDVCMKSMQFSFWDDKDTAIRTLQRISPEVWQRASQAWHESAKTNLSKGATHYCRYDVWPAWRTDPSMKFKGRIGRHVFYRES